MMDAGSLLRALGMSIGSKTCSIVFPGWHFEIVGMVLTFRERFVCSIKYEVCFCCIGFFVKYFHRALLFNKKLR